MKRYSWLLTLAVVCLLASPAMAWHVDGYVYCDVNENGVIDPEDVGDRQAELVLENLAGTFSHRVGTIEGGYYWMMASDDVDDYRLTLDPNFLPADAVIVVPGSGEYLFSLTDAVPGVERDWLYQSETCAQQEPRGCWMTGGGVKFVPQSDTGLAAKGPHHNMGGNVYPSCSPHPGDGGSWTHIAHKMQLHFHGTSIRVVRCGNVPGIDPGSESPVTPYNFIEYEGTGTLKGIKGNKVDYGTVHFWARVQDHNEPGSRGAKDGEDVDQYFLHVFADPNNPVATTLLLVDLDGDASTMDPVTITGGNLQLHISSCDDAPDF